MNIRPARSDDAGQIAAIYDHYITTSHATFEMEPIDGAEMLQRMNDGWAAGYPFLVCERDAEILGYAYGRQFRPRRAYLHSIEVSVYIKKDKEGKGIGSLLYQALFDEIRNKNFHTIIAGISLPNDASIRLHEKFGFNKVAHFCEVGRKFDRWIDVGYWQLLLAKRK